MSLADATCSPPLRAVYRGSPLCDLIEPVRPLVDRAILALLSDHPLPRRAFAERCDGSVRCSVAITRTLVEGSARWRGAVAPWAERAAVLLAEAVTGRSAARATPLTGDHRSAGRARQRRGPRRAPALGQLRLPAGCARCGEPVAGERTLCDACLPAVRAEALGRFAQAGPAAIARQRAAGADRTHGGRAATRRGATQAARHREAVAWQGEPTDPAAFAAEVLPAIERVPLRVLAARTGLSLRYCSLIRRGLRVPHRRWWERLTGVEAVSERA